MIDSHLAAEISIIGMTFDLVGGLYLAYDLLGGEDGPLGRIFRIANYTILMVIAIWSTMGAAFGMVAGVGLGTALALQVDCLARGKSESLKFLMLLGAIRSTSLCAAICLHKHYLLALIVAPIIFLFSLVLPRLKISPASLYHSGKKPGITKKQLILCLTIGLIATAVSFLTAGIAGGGMSALQFSTRIGFTFILAQLLISSASPLIEWYADNLPPKSFGYIGAVLFMLGFIIQSIPSIITILDS